MKRLAVYDFDGTLMDTPMPNPGKEIWKKKTGEEYPHQGWWSRKESLDTDVFDIKPLPNILNKFNGDMASPITHTIVLTSRMEKLRSEVQNILDLNGIHPDELILKKGRDDKGDIILKYLQNNPDLKDIVVYDDFAGGEKSRMDELTKIKDSLPSDVNYNIVLVDNGRVSRMVESTNILVFMITDEILKFKK